MINWFNMPAEGLSNGGLFEIKELEVTENGTYEQSGEMYNKVTVNVEGGGGETWQTVFEGSVTTEGAEGVPTLLENVNYLTADTIKVTFDGTEYTCEKTTDESPFGTASVYGDSTFTEYPFMIISTETDTRVRASAGTHSLKIEEPQSGGSSEFSKATLTITNTTENPVICEVPCYRDDAEIVSTRAVTFGAVGEEPTTAAFNVICKTNGATLTIATMGVTATTSGNIQYIEAEHVYIITGDCTITIS